MRIDQLGRPAPLAAARVRRRQEGFVVNEEEAPQELAQAAPAPTVANILGVASAAQTPSASPAQLDREAADHGDAMLNTLKKLQLAALGMEGGAARADLMALAGSLKQAADPGLNAVLQAIAARAAIEIVRPG